MALGKQLIGMWLPVPGLDEREQLEVCIHFGGGTSSYAGYGEVGGSGNLTSDASAQLRRKRKEKEKARVCACALAATCLRMRHRTPAQEVEEQKERAELLSRLCASQDLWPWLEAKPGVQGSTKWASQVSYSSGILMVALHQLPEHPCENGEACTVSVWRPQATALTGKPWKNYNVGQGEGALENGCSLHQEKR